MPHLKLISNIYSINTLIEMHIKILKSILYKANCYKTSLLTSK